ncbi:MAG: multidrug effflux MFS transporter [Gammaproteobacteria bacterium]|nr:multidrug effflux MFS transporter [Gammaproteobacteria bacterium]NVK86753.1 multidrug effflux MFS transporter [Gammaproteobacteria bacterium]
MQPSSTSPLRYLPLFAAIFAITPLAIDMYLPAMPQMAIDLNSDITEIQFSLSIFLAGYALGMLCFGPMADHYGRKFFLLAGLSGFTAINFALAYVPNVETFIVLRFVQALCGGAATVTVPGTIRDLFGRNTAKGMAYVSMAMMVAPMLAPSLGSVLLYFFNWPSIFIAIGTYALFILVMTIRYFPFIAPAKKSTGNLLRAVVNSYAVVFAKRVCYPFLTTTMLTTLTFFTYITSVSFVYISLYGISEQTFGILFGANVIALMLGNFINARLVAKWGPLTMLRGALFGALCSAAALFWSIYNELSLFWVVSSILLMMLHLMIISTNSDALVLMSFPHQSGTATAVIGTLKFGAGAFSGLLLSWLYDGTALPFATVIIICVTSLVVIQLLVWLLRLPTPSLETL